ncbi:hypothetical protein V6N11_080522 [Hibiscus sabdariffa]
MPNRESLYLENKVRTRFFRNNSESRSTWKKDRKSAFRSGPSHLIDFFERGCGALVRLVLFLPGLEFHLFSSSDLLMMKEHLRQPSFEDDPL